ncbi:hypothetical protein DPSP01_007968 [Paraphaeosphaeria sporulosa]|uniref:CFEM domain-containing protein n=1 Tax=Paraphaeosphaeria sporulosa TaxID=1460663 RepID=A0A177CFA4_9PLEO|nr:uncharacterized protein CC84DRAFT_1216951 [Paraphaeosphaeria sporulosa]OAG05622.1 hypothetical protein CC84DRAFT_1216951 [Paraphaeosphaeria sporulosa]
MRFSLSAVALLVTAVAAVDISGAPACAQTCLQDNQGLSTCDPNATEYTCFCADTAFYSAVQQCVLADCSLTDAVATLTWYNSVCAA